MKILNNIYKVGFFLALLLAIVSCQPSVFVLHHTDLKQVAVTDSITDDAEIAQLIAPYKEKLDAQMSRVIGKAEKNMYSSRGKEQTEIGNLLADLCLSVANQYYSEKIDLGVMTAGGIRAPLLKGDITIGSIFEIMPFENQLVVIKVRGDSLTQLLQKIYESKSVSISNCELEFTKGELTKALINKRELKKDEVYSLAISDYLANGGDGLSFLTSPLEFTVLDIKVRDAIIEYVEQQTKKSLVINGVIDNRVIFK